MKIERTRTYQGFPEYLATASIGQYSASVYGRMPLKAALKAAWNVHMFAAGSKWGFDPFGWMFK